jgi:hypothetical protein
MSSHWPKIIEQIPKAIRNQDGLNRFVEQLKLDAPERVDRILELLTPKSQKSLENGADKMLVDSLSNSNVDERALAIHQLTRITGKNLGFQADKPSAESIQEWRDLLAQGQIRYPSTVVDAN